MISISKTEVIAMNEMKQYVENIRQYLHNMLSDFKKSREWKNLLYVIKR